MVASFLFHPHPRLPAPCLPAGRGLAGGAGLPPTQGREIILTGRLPDQISSTISCRETRGIPIFFPGLSGFVRSKALQQESDP